MRKRKAQAGNPIRFFGWLQDERGQDLAEYGMLAALIAVVVIAALVVLGSSLSVLWGNITTTFAGLP